MVVRVVTLPVRLAYGVGKSGLKTGFTAGRLSVASSYKAGRKIGVSRMLAAGAGVGVGLLIAPMTGTEMRENVKRRIAARRAPASDDAVAERVRYELSHSPRTWHLPQPSVTVSGGTAILTGDAPHAAGKADIERAAAAVPGVAQVDSRLVLATGGDGESGVGGTGSTA